MEYDVLGEEFVQICQQNGLDNEGIRIVDEIYQEWLDNLGDIVAKERIAEEKVRDYDNQMAVIRSLSAISRAYIEEASGSPLGKFARKAREN